MPFIQLGDNQIPLRIGEMGLGTGANADIKVSGGNEQGVLATVQLFNDHHVAIKRVHPTAPIKVNGVQLGAEPSPLIHGDKIEAGGSELLFGDDKKQAGGTQVISGVSLPPDLRKSIAKPAKPTAATGGRLVSLVDGREFQVKATGLTLGRDAACDVVLPGTDISRNHAEISVSPDGYYVIDLSTNGVYVNGEKIEGTHTLGRGDVIRVGTEEFRFYADVPKPSAAPAPAPAPAPAAPAAAAPSAASSAPTTPKPVIPPAAPARKVAQSAEPTMPPQRASGARGTGSPGDKRAVLATLEIINEGPRKGVKHEIFGPLTHIGRGAHNDIMIDDDSVSDSHAKIQKRESGWFVADVGSTNGTYVGGRRIAAEQALVGAPDVRFGGVKMTFRQVSAGPEPEKQTRAIAGVTPEQVRRMSAAAEDDAASGDVVPERQKGGIPAAVWIAVVVVVLAAAAYFVLGR